MDVGELKELLKQIPDHLEVIHTRYSDYDVVQADDWSIVSGVPQSGGWIMRSHETMSKENKAKERQYLHLVGN